MTTHELSACCGKPVTVAGRTTRYYVCNWCGSPCDLTGGAE